MHFKGPRLGSWNSLPHSAESIPGLQDVSGDPLEEGRAWEGMVGPHLMHLKLMRETELLARTDLYSSGKQEFWVINLHCLLYPDLSKFFLTPISDTETVFVDDNCGLLIMLTNLCGCRETWDKQRRQ